MSKDVRPFSLYSRVVNASQTLHFPIQYVVLGGSA